MIIEQLQGARRAWALLCASATADPDRRHLIASLRSFLPAEFIADLLDRQLGRESHGLFGLLALCAAEVAAIYAYWLMESTGQPAFAAPGGTARSESFRMLALASKVVEHLEPGSPRALPALVAIAWGWCRFVQRFGGGSRRRH